MASSKQNSRKRDERSLVPSPTPSFYPVMPGYQFIMPPWGAMPFPGNFQYPWQPPWGTPQPFPNHGGYRPWQQEGMAGGRMHPPYRNEGPMTHEEYMLDSLRHIYSNDGSIEIERVKVQKGPQDTVCYTTTSRPVSRIIPVEDSEAVYASINVTHDGKVPPPRKRKKKRTAIQQLVPASSGDMPPQWIPYAPYMPYTYPCTFAFGYMPPSMPPYPHPPHHQPFATSPDLLRSRSPSDASENPSSKGDYKKAETKVGEQDASSQAGSTGVKVATGKNSRAGDTAAQSEKQRKPIEDTENRKEDQINASTRNNKLNSSFKDGKSANRERRTKSLDRINLKAELGYTKENRELVAAFRNLQEIAGNFERHARVKGPQSGLETPQDQTTGMERESERRPDSRERTASLSSVEHSIETVDSELIENDLTDTTLKDESSSQSEKDQVSSTLEESDTSFKWILKTDENDATKELEKDERTQPWRTEVSLWRARLIVSLCKGQSFDQQDWETFHLLVQHPLAISMKLSLLNAPRFCSSNTGVGVASLRNALLHFIPYGETLLREEAERPSDWKVVQLNDSHFWTTVKGSQEILRVFGYIKLNEEYLKYNEKCSCEVSVIARLSLDMLVLAEEFRLYLAGNHVIPANITVLFTQNYTASPPSISQVQELSRVKSSESSVLPTTDSSTSDSATLQTVIQNIMKDANKNPSLADNANKEESEEEEKVLSNEPGSSSHASSIPDLHSLNTTIPSLVMESDDNKEDPEKDPRVDSMDPKEGESLKPTAEEPPRRRSKVVSKDNPDEHIYEEICDLKTQEKDTNVENGQEAKAPPIPPKSKKSLLQSNADYHSIVPHKVDSRNISAPSTITRKKKRRAPMPPDFSIIQPQDERVRGQNETCLSLEETKRDEKIQDNNKDVTDLNPFNTKLVPSGFIGKNPFYEDIETKQPPEVSPVNPPSYSSIKKTSTDKCPASDAKGKPETDDIVQAPMEKLPKEEDSEKHDKKNLQEGLQCDSRVVAPISIPLAESSVCEDADTPNDNKILVKEDCKGVFAPPPTTLAPNQAPSLPPPKQCVSSITVSLEKNNLEKKNENYHKANQIEEKNIQNKPTNSKEFQGSDTKSLPRKNIIKLPPKSRLNPPYRKEESSIIKIQTAKSDSVENSPIIPPMPPPKAPLKLLDDIPYIDTNELHEIKHSLASAKQDDLEKPPERSPSPPPYSPPKIPDSSPPETPGTSPPASPVIFLRGSNGKSIIIDDKKAIEVNSERNRDEKSASIFEERYEIPDHTQIETNLKILNERSLLLPANSTAKNSQSPKIKSRDESPDRPKRKIRPSQPPPRPPKPLDPNAPPLPPKITNFRESLWHSSSSLEGTLSTTSTADVCLSSPSLIDNRSRTLPSKSPSQRNQGDKISVQLGPRSASTPSSPKSGQRPVSSKNPKAGKSWSSVFCDCVDAKDTNGKKNQK